jgi:hypothetical protein
MSGPKDDDEGVHPDDVQVVIMTKREHFAFCAMQAMILPIDNPEKHAATAARAAFVYADAMMAESRNAPGRH